MPMVSTATKSTSLIDYECPNCGSENVVRDAVLKWDYPTQKWTIKETFQSMFCESCHHESDEMFEATEYEQETA